MVNIMKSRGESNPVWNFMQLVEDGVLSEEKLVNMVGDPYGSQHVALVDVRGRPISSVTLGGNRSALPTTHSPLDVTEPLIVGDLTSTGVQWGAGPNGSLGSAVTVIVNTWYTLFQRQLSTGLPAGPILWAELGLTIELSANNDNSTGEWQWQVSEDGTTWVDLHPIVAEADIDTSGTGAIERTRQGYPRLIAAFDSMVFYIRLRVRATSPGDTVMARVKSSSYARVIYLPS